MENNQLSTLVEGLFEDGTMLSKKDAWEFVMTGCVIVGVTTIGITLVLIGWIMLYKIGYAIGVSGF